MTASVAEHVARLYDSAPEREWARMDRHRTEFHITMRALRQYLPPPPARVLDCGGGPGRFAVELARQGYQVTLFDLSAGNLALVRAKAVEAGVTLAGIEQGTALNLGRFPDDSFDAVLLMGPLYHLLEEAERARALAEAYRVLKPDGPLFAAFITRFAAHRDCAGGYPEKLLADGDVYAEILRTGRLPPAPGVPTRFSAYFARPEEVPPLVWGAGFELATTLGVEGFVSALENYGINTLTGPAWDAWCEANWLVASDPLIFGAVEHLLAVAFKPRWRAVLADIARQLHEMEIRYAVVGGTSLALHGLPVRVRDIDIEMDVEGAYRFAERFGDRILEPVALKESVHYRSHFGRLDFDGVTVEVMGALERREVGAWVPTDVTHTEAVELGDQWVMASWLEEEVLAYIRRGRLDRATLCLSRCGQAHLVELLHGHAKTRTI